MPVPSIVGTPTGTRYTEPLSNTAGTDANYAIGFLHDDAGSLTLSRAAVGAMTQVHAYGGMNFMQVFGQANPDTGARDCDIGAGATALTHIECTAKDVDTAAPWDTFASAAGSSVSPAVTCTTDAGALALAFVQWNGAGITISAGSGETVVFQFQEDSRGGAILSKAGAASVAFAPTLSSSTTWAIAAAGLNGTASGPTVTVQPTAQTARVNGESAATATFTGTATGTGTVDATTEIEDGVASGVYGTLANGSGATWSGLTGTGSGSATATPVGTFTAKTLNGRRVRIKFEDDNGITYSNAVALTVYTGPVLSTYSGTGAGAIDLSGDEVLGTGYSYRVTVTPTGYASAAKRSHGRGV